MGQEYHPAVVRRVQLRAFHEAAHAVADVRFGFGCKETSLESDGLYDGFTTSVEQHPDRFQDRYLVSLLVGYAAELRLGSDEETARREARHDFRAAAPILKEFMTLGMVARILAGAAGKSTVPPSIRGCPKAKS